MVVRITSGAVAGWLLGLAPLIVVNVVSLVSGAVDPSSTAIAGVLALALGIALGGLAAGLIGGRQGGAIAGVIAGAFFAASLIALEYTLKAQGNLPNLVVEHPVRTMGALVFIGALLAGVAFGVAALLSLRAARAEAKALATFAAARAQGASIRPFAPDSAPVRGASQPRPPTRDMTPSRRLDGEKPSDPRRAQSAGASRPAPARSAFRPASQYDERYDQRYDERAAERYDEWGR